VFIPTKTCVMVNTPFWNQSLVLDKPQRSVYANKSIFWGESHYCTEAVTEM